MLNTFSSDRKVDSRWKYDFVERRWDNLKIISDNPEKQHFLVLGAVKITAAILRREKQDE